jgi:hypothetical protein
MKKILAFAILVVIGIASMAAIPMNPSALSNNERVFCKKISIGMKNARIVLPNDEKLVIPINQLDAYQLGNALYVKKELATNGKSRGQFAYMQLLKTKDNYSLYRMAVKNPELVQPGESLFNYYVYEGDKLYLEASGQSLPNVLAFFGIKYSY